MTNAFTLAALLLGTLALAGVNSTSDPWKTSEVRWTCTHTYKDFPKNRYVLLRYNSLTGEIDLSAFRELINEFSTKYPTIDFQGCLAHTLYLASTGIYYDDHETDRPLLLAIGQEIRAKLGAMIKEYGALAYKNGALSPIEPGQPGVPEMPKDYAAGVVSTCGQNVTSSMLVAEILDELKPLPVALSHDCADTISAKWANALLASLPDHVQCERSPVLCKQRRAAVDAVKERLVRLGHLRPKPAGDTGTDPCDHPSLQAGNLTQIARSIDKAAPCVQLKAGESRVINGDPGTGIPAQYTLTRNAEKSYTARVNINFDASDLGFSEPKAKKLEQDKVRAKARDCLGRASNLLRGPKGEKLTLALYDSVDLANSVPEPSRIDIRLQKPGFRSDAGNWEQDIDCDTITHEVLHLLGLVDEYSEPSMAISPETGKIVDAVSGQPTSDNCRITGPATSVMHSQWFAFEAVGPYYDVIYCVCPLPKTALRKGMASAFEKETYERCLNAQAISKTSKQCAPGTREARAIESLETREVTDKLKGLSYVASDGGYRYRLGSAGLSKAMPNSVLFPAHFRAITQPGCKAVNGIYYACAKEAYKTSKEAYGSGGCSAELPPECTSSDRDWLQ